VVGTRAIDDPVWLDLIARRHPGRVIVAADVRGRDVVVRGWAEAAGRRVVDLLEEIDPLPLGGVLVTAVHREGRLAGPDIDLVVAAKAATRHPVLASGGIGSIADLRAVARAGAAATVIGMALYVGALDARAVAKEFAQ
jgi:phosphoribosylformimino-5-aminoimidazole carboxamide ribotide isomerase